MVQADILQESDPTYEIYIYIYIFLQTELQEQLLWKDLIRRQKSKRTLVKGWRWKYQILFHLSTIVKSRHNHIATIKDNNGNWLHDHDQISSYLINRFGGLFFSSNPTFPPKLDDLINPIITHGKKKSKPNKNTKKVKKFGILLKQWTLWNHQARPKWSTIEEDFIQIVWNFFNAGYLEFNIYKFNP